MVLKLSAADSIYMKRNNVMQLRVRSLVTKMSVNIIYKIYPFSTYRQFLIPLQLKTFQNIVAMSNFSYCHNLFNFFPHFNRDVFKVVFCRYLGCGKGGFITFLLSQHTTVDLALYCWPIYHRSLTLSLIRQVCSRRLWTYDKKWKTLWQKKKLHVLSNFFFCHYVFKKPSAAEAFTLSLIRQFCSRRLWTYFVKK